MKTKRYICVVLVLMLAIFLPCNAFCQDFLLPYNANDIAIARALAIKYDLNPDTISIIPITGGNPTGTASAPASSDISGKAIQYSTNLPDGSIEVMTIIPFIELPNGTLVNSFAAMSAGTGIAPMDTTQRYSDMDLTLKGTYKTFPMAIMNTFPGYQMYKASFRWTKSSSSSTTSKVSYIKVHSCVAGVLYTNPSDGSEPQISNSNFSREKTITKTNPVISTWYSTSNAMSTSEGIVRCTDALEHGGWAFVEFNYVDANGVSRTGDFSTWCFRK